MAKYGSYRIIRQYGISENNHFQICFNTNKTINGNKLRLAMRLEWFPPPSTVVPVSELV